MIKKELVIVNGINNTQDGSLLDLYIEWEIFLNRRINALPGSLARRNLDMIYTKVLPSIIEISESIDDSEINRLVKQASNLLNQRGSNVQTSRSDK
jgi:hypothetical protein